MEEQPFGHNIYMRDSSLIMPETVVPERISTDNPSDVFGYGQLSSISVAYDPEVNIGRNEQHYNFIIFSSLQVFIFIFFAVSFYRFRDQFYLLFKFLFSPRDISESIEKQGITFRHFINLTNYIGFFCVVALAMKLIMVFNGSGGFSGIIYEYDGYLILAVICGLLLIFAYRFIIHKAIMLFTMDVKNIEELISFNKIIFSICTVMYLPFIFSMAVWENQFAAHTEVILLWVPILFLLYYGIKTFRFFIVRKFSIFQWFLYLCTVEILPISFCLILVMRGFELNF